MKSAAAADQFCRIRQMVYRLLVVLLLASLPGVAEDRAYGSRSVARSKGAVSKARSVGGHPRAASSKCTTCQQDANGRIKRPAARREFQKQHPCPATGKTTGACPGYVVDHIVALRRGGLDEPSNMQWQTTADAKAKDRIE
jgi:hypothetical protein